MSQSDKHFLDYDTKQFEQKVLIKSGLDVELDPKKFLVLKDLAWFPNTPQKNTYIVPDVMVITPLEILQQGNKKWIEGDIRPLAIFEMTNSEETFTDLLKKYKFYEAHAVQEYYLFHLENNTIEGWLLKDNQFVAIESIDGFQSPSLGISFKTQDDKMTLFHTEGNAFTTYRQIRSQIEKKNQNQREFYRQTTDAKIRKMVKKLREMGINPDHLIEE